MYSRFQLILSAVDGGTPQLSASISATVIVSVLRNQNPPQFFNTPYSRSIQGNQATGVSIIAVTASDADANLNNNVSAIFLHFIIFRYYVIINLFFVQLIRSFFFKLVKLQQLKKKFKENFVIDYYIVFVTRHLNIVSDVRRREIQVGGRCTSVDVFRYR